MSGARPLGDDPLAASYSTKHPTKPLSKIHQLCKVSPVFDALGQVGKVFESDRDSLLVGAHRSVGGLEGKDRLASVVAERKKVVMVLGIPDPRR